MKNIVNVLILLVFCAAKSQKQFTVYFDSNKFELPTVELTKLDLWVSQNTSIKIIGANGYCDEDGSAASNDTLAKKRINTVFTLLKNRLKFREDFKSHSFGELHKLSSKKAENRKVTLFFIEPKDFERENEILGIKNRQVEVSKKTPIIFLDKMVLENPDGSSQEILLDTVFMQKMNLARKGETLNIKNLNFVINTFIVVPQSRSKMYELLQVMRKNPTIKIQIQGHLCCNADDKRDLSGYRAKAIAKFLENNNIDKSRISFIGFGGKKPLYSIPEKTEEERAANRRVEILITEN